MNYRVNKYIAGPLFDAAADAAAAATAATAAAAAEAAKAASDKAAADAAKAASDKTASDKAAADKAAADKAALEAGKTTPTDAEAKLIKETMARKAKIEELEGKLKEFDGIDVAAVKKMLADQVAAEKAALEAKGDFDRVKTMMGDEHTKALKAVTDKLAKAEGDSAKLNASIAELTVGQSFASSDFVTKQLILPIPKARQIYGANFDIEDGEVVAYDKPKGASDRTKLVDATGKPLPFEAAIERIVKADPDHASLLKSKLAKGANSTTDGNLTAEEIAKAAKGLTGMARIKAVLDAQNKKK